MNPAERSVIEAQLDAAALSCLRQGVQLTELRRQVLELVMEAEAPSTAYQLLDRLKQSRKGAVPPTIYRALDFLVAQRLVHKVERLNAFIACSETAPHDHPVQFLICGRCGSVAEIEDRAISRALTRAAEREGFHPARPVVELEGISAACAHPP